MDLHSVSISLYDLWWFFRWPILCALWLATGSENQPDNGIFGMAAIFYTIIFANYGV